MIRLPVNTKKKCLLVPVLTLLFCGPVSFAQSPGKYWVYFRDKGPSLPLSGPLSKNSTAYSRGLEYVTPRALARRAKVLPPDAVLDARDLPLYEPYLHELEELGAMHQRRSRWLNAASFLLTPGQAGAISQLPFVRKVTPVVIFRGRDNEEKIFQPQRTFSKTGSFDYGPSTAQAEAINVPPLHELGITGHNVIIGMLDTGFRWRAHESLQSRAVIAEHDFIQDDDTTANQAGDSQTQDQHGTLTMSTIGGYMPGQLIGPAFNASFVLAKTEYVPTETMIEEDNWANAIEWMEGLGVDVASSSLGYNNFDPQTSEPTDYRWIDGDFDGRTSVTARAAARAAELGVVVSDAMGNEGNGDGVIGTMLTPADADSIISVGAVSFSRELAVFSSTGPTNDGRIKPDVVAPGVSVYCASTGGFSSYFNTSGTSLATPLTGGSAALLLSARPELTPVQVRDALRNTAAPITDSLFFPASPNNFTGWGHVNAFDAALSFGPIFSDEPSISVTDSSSTVSIWLASKSGIKQTAVLFHYAIGSSGFFDSIPMAQDCSMFFATSGRYRIVIPPQPQGTLIRFYISATDSAALSYQSPAPITGNSWHLNYGTTDVDLGVLLPEGYALLQNYPNPFNPETRITYDLPRKEHVRIQVINVLGNVIATLVDEVQEACNAKSRPPVIFNGNNLPSGVYFYRITTSSFSSTKKMILVR